jgi:hypothetical protein
MMVDLSLYGILKMEKSCPNSETLMGLIIKLLLDVSIQLREDLLQLVQMVVLKFGTLVMVRI